MTFSRCDDAEQGLKRSFTNSGVDFEKLLNESSLGTPVAKAIQGLTTAESAEEISNRVDYKQKESMQFRDRGSLSGAGACADESHNSMPGITSMSTGSGKTWGSLRFSLVPKREELHSVGQISAQPPLVAAICDFLARPIAGDIFDRGRVEDAVAGQGFDSARRFPFRVDEVHFPAALHSYGMQQDDENDFGMNSPKFISLWISPKGVSSAAPKTEMRFFESDSLDFQAWTVGLLHDASKAEPHLQRIFASPSNSSPIEEFIRIASYPLGLFGTESHCGRNQNSRPSLVGIGMNVGNASQVSIEFNLETEDASIFSSFSKLTSSQVCFQMSRPNCEPWWCTGLKGDGLLADGSPAVLGLSPQECLDCDLSAVLQKLHSEVPLVQSAGRINRGRYRKDEDLAVYGSLENGQLAALYTLHRAKRAS